MKFIYIAGPYMGKAKLHNHLEYFEIDANINQAAEAAAKLAQAGIGFFCPHLHSAHFEVITPDIGPDYWYQLDLNFLSICDAILMLPGWEESSGAKMEKKIAEDLGLPVFISIEPAIRFGREPLEIPVPFPHPELFKFFPTAEPSPNLEE